MTVPFGAMDRVGILRSLFPPPIAAQPDATSEVSLDPLAQSQKEMNLYGITAQQRKGYIPRVSEVLYNNIAPNIYLPDDLVRARVPSMARQLFTTKEALKPDETNPTVLSNNARFMAAPGQEDSWLLYLGLPQRNKTFSVSPYRPSKSTEDKHYFRINDFFDTLLDAEGARMLPYNLREKAISTKVKGLLNLIKENPKGRLMLNDDHSFNLANGGIMRNFQLSQGKDDKGPYIAMYDRWDLNFPHADKIGQPYEVYDRLYYDPKTFKPIPESRLQSVVPLEEAKNAKRKGHK